MIAFDDDLRALIARHLASFDRRVAGRDGLRTAAVAFTVVGAGRGNAGFLLTRRAAGMRAHASQWALPGGRVETGETIEAAALRELEEEVGLPLPPGAVLGVLDDYVTRSGYHIVPVVVWGGHDPPVKPQESEVQTIVTVPLTELLREPRFLDGDDPERPVLQMPLGEKYIHAPTAAVLYQFREVRLNGRPTRVAHFEQPSFAWR